MYAKLASIELSEENSKFSSGIVNNKLQISESFRAKTGAFQLTHKRDETRLDSEIRSNSEILNNHPVSF